ncbi:MAG: SET domain-containing protein [Saprospiraceae bacterium]|nr:SET domain-containing protein [Saprospiraceae bacterium]
MTSNNNQYLNSQFAKIKFDGTHQQNGLIALKNFKKDSIICHFSAAEVLPYPSRYTVQVGDEKHIILAPLFLEYINHSCDPNCFFDTKEFVLKAVKNIQSGEEFSFFYPSTEWDMDEPFDCHCGSDICLGQIQGAKYLSDNDFAQYRFTDFITQKLQKTRIHVFQD